ncbi:hypothetical protein [Aquiflexum sp.]|uniref:hypothetical protein n=1 Tax=Aquiflexum sp. TaxID=1872584 RepID=UPI00359464C3
MKSFSDRIFQLLLAVLLISFGSCTSYMNINRISSPLTLGIKGTDTLSWDYFEGVLQGDKIRVTDKSNISHEIMFSFVSDGMLHGLTFWDPVSLKKVKPYDFSIPINRISQVRGIGKGSEIEDKEKPEFYFSDLYKLKKGDKIMIEKKNGQPHYMYFKESEMGCLWGSWGSKKNDRKMPTEEIEIPISKLQEITVKSFNSSRSELLTIGFAGIFLAILIIAYIANPIYIN